MYFFKKNGKVFGPFPLEKLQDMVSKGRIAPDNSISEDRSNWVEASKIKELFPDLAINKSIVAEPKVPESQPEPVVKIKEELKVKQREQPSYVETMAPPLSLAGQDEQEEPSPEKINFMAIFWNPVQALPAVRDNSSKNKIIGISILFIFFNSLFAVIALCVSKIYPVDLKTILISSFISIIPWLVLFVLLLILTKIFSENNEVDAQGSMLISSSTFFPACMAVMLVSFINLLGILSSIQVIVLLAGAGIYFTAFAVLLLFNACTRILGIKGSGTVFVVSTLLVVSLGISGFFMKLLLG